jgi:hypothetical protein
MSIDPDERRRQAQAISNAMTKFHRDHYGRGSDRRVAEYTLIDMTGRAGDVAEQQYDDDLT